MILVDTQTPCYAYCIMSNHVHILLQTGPTSISKVMQSLLTGYAVSYNLRHNRAGKLYQNRFKSVLCDKDDYFRELIRYIHLNPIRVKLINNMSELDKSPWTGHSIIMDKKKAEWFCSKEVLSNFGSTRKKALSEYRAYIQEGLDEKEPTDLSGGGLIRSMGGVWEVLKASRDKKRQKEAADERILGGGTFVEAVLEYAEERESMASKLKREGWDFKKVLEKAAEAVGLEKDKLLQRGRGNSRSEGRALLCKWLVDDLSSTRISVARELGITGPSVRALVLKGKEIAHEKGIGF